MANLGQGKWCRYEVVINGQTYNYDDPNGWDSIKTVLQRSDNFGINSEISADDLQFPDEMYSLFRQAYFEHGKFAQATINVFVQNWKWEEELYQVYDVDFSTYKDDINYVSLKLISNTTTAKISANFDTEYKISLEQENLYTLDYKSAKVLARNVLSYEVGSMYHHSFGYLFKGSRTTRAYDADLTFYRENTDSEPYGYMEARALNNITNMEVEVGLNIKIHGINLASCYVAVISYDNNGSNSNILKLFEHTSRNNGFIFNYSKEKLNVNLQAGKHIGLFVIANVKFIIDYIDSNGLGVYMAFNKYTTSGQNGKNLLCFDFDWLISNILKKIDSNSLFVNNIINENIKYLLASSDCMRAIGNERIINGRVKTSLKDALKAYNVLEAIALDIDGSTITINPIQSHYKNEQAIEVDCANLILEHDQTHTFSTFKVGSKNSSNEDSGNYTYNTEKIFGIQDSESFSDEKGNELDLSCPYITDPFTIDSKIVEYANNTGKADSGKNEIVVFACKNSTLNRLFSVNGEYTAQYTLGTDHQYILKTHEGAIGSTPETMSVHVLNGTTNKPIQDTEHTTRYLISENIDLLIEISGSGFVDYLPSISYLYSYGDITINEYIETFENGNCYYKIRLSIIPYSISNFSYFDLDVNVNIKEQTENISISYLFSGETKSISSKYHNLYKEQEIQNYDGDILSAYNLALSPKRILLKHLPYISISNFNSEKTLKFLSSDNSSNIISKLAYETQFIEENAELNTVTPLFLPIKATFDFKGELDVIKLLKSNKYGYIKTIYRGKTYTFWINEISVQVGKEQSQEGTGIVRLYDL